MLLNRMTLPIALALLPALSACGWTELRPEDFGAQRPDQEARGELPISVIREGPLIMVIGDSLFHGAHLDPEDRMAPQLQRILRSQGLAATVFDLGSPSISTTAQRANIVRLLDAMPREPALFIIATARDDVRQGVSVSEARDAIDTMVRELTRRHIPVLISGMPVPSELTGADARLFRTTAIDMATKYAQTDHTSILGEGSRYRHLARAPDSLTETAIDALSYEMSISVLQALDDSGRLTNEPIERVRQRDR